MSSVGQTPMLESGFYSCEGSGAQNFRHAVGLVSDNMQNFTQQQTTDGRGSAGSSSGQEVATATHAHDGGSVMYEDGQHLLEYDPQFPGRISKAAEEAQQAKWRRLMANRPPLEKISRTQMPTSGSRPPLYRLGIPYTMEYMFAYAQRHHLTFEIPPEDRDLWGGKEVVDFANIQNVSNFSEDFAAYLGFACGLTRSHISERCGLILDDGRPFAMEYDGILSVWSNYDMRARYRKYVGSPKRFDEIAAALHEALNEECDMGGMGELRWWFDWDNDVNIFTTLK